jgi:hypothetical protein
MIAVIFDALATVSAIAAAWLSPRGAKRRGDPESQRCPTFPWIAASPCGLLAMTV